MGRPFVPRGMTDSFGGRNVVSSTAVVAAVVVARRCRRIVPKLRIAPVRT